jgi:hypothetical protein
MFVLQWQQRRRLTCAFLFPKRWIRQGLAYRKANPWLELEKQNRPHPMEAGILKYTCAGFHGTKLDGGPIQIIRAGLTNVTALFERNDVTHIIEEMTKKKEQAFLMADRCVTHVL